MRLDPRHALISLAAAGSMTLAGPMLGHAQVTTVEQSTAQAVLTRRPGPTYGRGPVVASYQAIVDNENVGNDNSASGSAGGPMMTDDQFLTMAMTGTAIEVEAGRLAQSRAGSDDVREFASRLVEDHQAALEDAAQVAEVIGVAAPQAPTMNEQRELLVDLSGMSGSDFDRLFVRSMIKEHKADIAEFTEAATDRSGEVAAFAERQLPVLREHLTMAQDVAGRIGLDTKDL